MQLVYRYEDGESEQHTVDISVGALPVPVEMPDIIEANPPDRPWVAINSIELLPELATRGALGHEADDDYSTCINPRHWLRVPVQP